MERMEWKLTGETRYRKSLFGKIILQVEIEYYDNTEYGASYGKEFRDANQYDLLFLSSLNNRDNKP